jgi:magnesium transporter
MSDSVEQRQEEDPIELVSAHLEAEDKTVLRQQLQSWHPAEIANLLESLPPNRRRLLWEEVPAELDGEVIAYLRDEVRATIIDEMEPHELVAAAESMDVEDLAEVIEELPEDITETILGALEDDHRRRLEATLAFEEGTAGRLMSRDVISVRQDVSLAVVLRYLRRQPSLPQHTDALMVIGEDGGYLGKLLLADVVTGNPDASVADVMQAEADWVYADADERDVAQQFERRDLISVAVLDAQRKLLGRITIDDMVDVIRAVADQAVLKRAGLREDEDLFAPVLPSAKRRAVWLGINLVTVFIASMVIDNFEEVLSKIVALAVLMPVVASMGGIAGSQTLTLTIRGLALGQISSANTRWLANKEILVGVLNGLAWALVVALVAVLWFGNWGIGGVMAAAMIVNLLAAAISGVVIPLVLQRLGIDPALSGAVILTTVTDVVGFMSFLGLATVFLI